jgi:hypothetical protein
MARSEWQELLGHGGIGNVSQSDVIGQLVESSGSGFGGAADWAQTR